MQKDTDLLYLLKEFEKESDRAAVILAVSLIDETITSLIKGYLIPNPSNNDDLFDGANSALSTFSSKISMCHRLGLISSNLARDLNLFRKIRNSFAHDVYGCDFESGSVKNRISAIDKSIVRADYDKFIDVNKNLLAKQKITIPQNSRGSFLLLSTYILSILHDIKDNLNQLGQANKEWIYIEKEDDSIEDESAELKESKNSD